MTRQQSRLLACIRDYIAEHGYSPSYADLCAAMGIASKSGIARLVEALVAQGHLKQPQQGRRSLELADAAPMPDAELHRTIHTLTAELAAARARIAELERDIAEWREHARIEVEGHRLNREIDRDEQIQKMREWERTL